MDASARKALDAVLTNGIKYVHSKYFDGWDPKAPEIQEVVNCIPRHDPFATFVTGNTQEGLNYRLSAAQERLLFVQMNWYKKRCSELVDKYKKRHSTSTATAIVDNYEKALYYQSAIVTANLPLVFKFLFEVIYHQKNTAFHDWFRVEKIEFQGLLSNGNYALIRAADKFNVDTGYKFSTYASVAIKQGFMRAWGTDLQRRTIVYSMQSENTPDIGSDARRRNQKDFIEVLEIQEDIDRMMDIFTEECEKAKKKKHANWQDRNPNELTMDEITVIKRRFLSHEKLTLDDIGTELNLTKERIRQMEVTALNKLRNRMLSTA